MKALTLLTVLIGLNAFANPPGDVGSAGQKPLWQYKTATYCDSSGICMRGPDHQYGNIEFDKELRGSDLEKAKAAVLKVLSQAGESSYECRRQKLSEQIRHIKNSTSGFLHYTAASYRRDASEVGTLLTLDSTPEKQTWSDGSTTLTRYRTEMIITADGTGRLSKNAGAIPQVFRISQGNMSDSNLDSLKTDYFSVPDTVCDLKDSSHTWEGSEAYVATESLLRVPGFEDYAKKVLTSPEEDGN